MENSAKQGVDGEAARRMKQNAQNVTAAGNSCKTELQLTIILEASCAFNNGTDSSPKKIVDAEPGRARNLSQCIACENVFLSCNFSPFLVCVP